MPSPVTPCMRYHDAPAAIEWLCSVFGFERQLVVPGDNNTIAHAQLTLGDGMVMLSSVYDSPASRLMAQPEELGGRETQATCLRVPDADEAHTKAVNAGATITIPLQDVDYGGRSFSCIDPGGHHWHVGTYDPWASPD